MKQRLLSLHLTSATAVFEGHVGKPWNWSSSMKAQSNKVAVVLSALKKKNRQFSQAVQLQFTAPALLLRARYFYFLSVQLSGCRLFKSQTADPAVTVSCYWQNISTCLQGPIMSLQERTTEQLTSACSSASSLRASLNIIMKVWSQFSCKQMIGITALAVELISW